MPRLLKTLPPVWGLAADGRWHKALTTWPASAELTCGRQLPITVFVVPSPIGHPAIAQHGITLCVTCQGIGLPLPRGAT